ncbi:hypothetical protein ASF30_04725 [Leifsonia sp. Leaf264]|nr:hypothetical protein ASF30_04725 [Leifsonia sp. Leaf264]
MAAIVALAGAVVGAASIGGFATGAYATFTAGPPRTVEQNVAPDVEAAPAAVGSSPLPASDNSPPAPDDGTDPFSAEYNPATTPGDPDYLSTAMLSEWFGQQEVIKECMESKGQPYLAADPRFGESPQPHGLSFEASIAFLKALNGDDIYMPSPGGGCSGVGEAAAEAAREAGTPLSGAVPTVDPGRPTPRQTQLAFEDVIRKCMAEKGHEFLGFTSSWDPTAQPSNPNLPAGMPEGLSPDQQSQWVADMDGDAGVGPAYRWQDAGCSGYATHATGNDNMH